MMQSSPDGSALLVIERSPQGGRLKLRVFHHASFGKNPSGIAFSLPEEFDEATQLTVSSLARRKYVYLIAHLPSSASLQSISLRISRTEVEYLFRQKEARTALPNAIQTKNNSLIDCFVDVWERFPIIPAIARSVCFFGLRPRFTYAFLPIQGVYHRSIFHVYHLRVLWSTQRAPPDSSIFQSDDSRLQASISEANW